MGIPVRADLPVGEKLQNHPALFTYWLIKERYQHLAPSTDNPLTIDNLYQYYFNHSGPLTVSYLSYTYFSTQSNSDPEWPNGVIETSPTRYPTSLDGWRQYRFGERRKEWQMYFQDFYGKNVLLAQPVLQRVRSAGFVRLQSSNPFTYPIINPKFLSDPQDLQDYIDAVKFVFYIYERSSIAPYLEPHKPIPGCRMCANRDFVYQCDSYVRCYITQLVNTGYHPTSTCRMGDPRRPDTVVDPRLRVKGFKGLRVCDASVMPNITNGNTNAPTIMIGEKCAAIVKNDHML